MLPPGLLRLLQISGRRGLGWVRSAAAADVDAIADNVAVAQRRAAAPAALLDSVADKIPSLLIDVLLLLLLPPMRLLIILLLDKDVLLLLLFPFPGLFRNKRPSSRAKFILHCPPIGRIFPLLLVLLLV